MKDFWHFLKSNIKYNKIELTISYGMTFLVFIVFYFLQDAKEGINGETLLSVGFYALLYAFFSNKKKFNLKYLLSLPLSKGQLLVIKPCADIIFFLPSVALFFVGIHFSKASVNGLLLILALLQGMFIVSLFLFDNDVEQPRLENSKASFINRLVYLRKWLDKGFSLLALALLGSMIFYMPAPSLLKQYLVILTLSFSIGIKYRQSLKLIQDESLSYFIFKRDGLRMGLKAVFVLVPVAASFYYYPKNLLKRDFGNHKIYSLIQKEKMDGLESYLRKERASELLFESASGYTPVLAAIELGKDQALSLLLKNGFTVSWQPVKGANSGLFPSHLAALSNNTLIMEELLKRNGESLERQTSDELLTPLSVAAKGCRNEMVEYLLKKGARVDAQDANGETPIMQAIKSECHSSLALLLEYGAAVDIKNKKQKSALDLIGKNNGMYYMVQRASKLKRGIASQE